MEEEDVTNLLYGPPNTTVRLRVFASLASGAVGVGDWRSAGGVQGAIHVLQRQAAPPQTERDIQV